MACTDGLIEAEAEKLCGTWVRKLLDSTDEIATFVATRRQRGDPERIVNYYKGSFNICIHIKFRDEGPDAIIRFPKEGLTSFRDEKVQNEVFVMEFLRQKTTIPLPRILSWGLTADSPKQLGPFIIMDYVEGTLLSDILKKPTQTHQEKEYLNPEIDDMTLNLTYYQIANFMLQIYDLDFTHIGAISPKLDNPTIWSVTSRPLTYNMNELATFTSYPVDHFPTTPFTSTNSYFISLANQHLTHLLTQRNIVTDGADAQRRYIARHLFAKLAASTQPRDNNDPFKLFCDDFRPANILVDPETLRITAVLDLEFTNAMPAQFARDPPWWLLLVGPDMWLDRGHTIEAFIEAYTPRMEQFVQAMERVEVETGRDRTGKDKLSGLMRDAWQSGEFWVNFAARKSIDIDELFESQIGRIRFDETIGPQLLDLDVQGRMEEFIKIKMEQSKEYKRELSRYVI